MPRKELVTGLFVPGSQLGVALITTQIIQHYILFLMSQKHNGKASMGHNMNRDGISSDSNNNLGKTGLAVLRISVVPQPDKVIQYLKSMYLHCLSECGSSNIY